jgi:putative ABC transport system permease protein
MNWTQRLKFVTRKEDTTRELDEELQYHLEHMVEEKIAAGMPAAEARCAALREFGGVAQISEECRSSRGMDWLEGVVQDVRYALRSFRRSPGLALTVLGLTAVGIGATTAVFSVVDRVLFRSMPYEAPERLVTLGISLPMVEFDFLTAYTYRELRRDPSPLEAIASWSGVSHCDLTENQPVRLDCARVEAAFLPLLGVAPFMGRGFTEAEDQPAAPPVAIVSHGLWKSRFGGRQDAVGQSMALDGRQVRVIGVLAADFELPGLERADILLPQAIPANVAPGVRPLRIYGRLRPGATLEQAREAIASWKPLLSEIPPQARKDVSLRLRSLRDLRAGDFRLESWTLLAAVMAMLLIACANAANLLLARSMSRQRELAIRVALGAGRARIARQALTESLVLAVAGGLAGCVLAAFLVNLFVWIAPAGIPHLSAASLDMRVLLFALAASLACGVGFGMAPALRTPRPEALTGTRTTGRRSLAARHVLVGAQLAVSLVLLTSAGLLLESLWKRQSVELGIRTDRMATAQLTPGARYAQPAARLAFYEGLEKRFAGLPGVEAAALSDSLPPGGTPRTQPFFGLQAEGRPPAQEGTGGTVTWRSVTPDYFRALGIRILRGRGFNEEDRAASARSIVLSETLARRLFPDGEPVGRRMRRFRAGGPPRPGAPRAPEASDTWYTVIGVAADARNMGLTDGNNPEYYVVRRRAAGAWEDAPPVSSLIVRGAGSEAAVASWIRAELTAADPQLPAVIRSFDEHVGELAARPRFQAVLLAMFAGIGLLLAASGLYGLVSYLAVQREREIGVRLSLGATPRQIAGMMIGHAFRWTIGGVLGGLAGSALAARALRGLLFQVSPADPLAWSGAMLLLLMLALGAALLPSLRAASLDPSITLRQD